MKMAEKKEQLKLTKSRLKILRKSTGKSIIDFFRGTNLKSEEESRIDDYWYSGETFEMMSDDEFQIEQILMEAGAYGMRNEVDRYAKRLLMKNPLSSKVDAYVKAYHKLIDD